MPSLFPYAPIILLVLDWLIRIGLAVRIVMRRYTVPVSLAWLIVVLFMPVIGLAAYLLVGETRLGRRRAARVERLTRETAERTIALWAHQHHDWSAHDLLYEPLARLGTSVSGLPPLRGNTLELIDDTETHLDRLVADIDAAEHHCHLLYYIWQADGKPTEVARALIRAAGRGVTCRVLVDDVGSRPLLKSRLAAEMRRAGVRLASALPANPLRAVFARLDLRNHRKLCVIDGRIAYTGSHNLTDTAFKLNPTRRVGPWIDASIRIEGPAAQALQSIFLTDWQLDAGESISSLADFIPDLPHDGVGESVIHVIPSGPAAGPATLHHALLAALYLARTELIMTTPYFVPDEATKDALINAAMRGVETTIVVPSRNDSRLVAAASRSHYADLLDAGVTIREYDGGLLHAKTVTIDRQLAVIGSANFDMRSFWLNFELTLIIYDSNFASMVRFLQTAYMQQASRIHREEWHTRPARRRFVDNAAQLLGPLL